MNSIRVVRIGDAEQHLLDAVRSGLARELRMPCSIDAAPLDPSFAHHPERNQFHSTRLIEHLETQWRPSVVAAAVPRPTGWRAAASAVLAAVGSRVPDAESRESGTRSGSALETRYPVPGTRYSSHPAASVETAAPPPAALSSSSAPGEMIVGVTDVDLYIPILSFVFGEAQLGGHTAVVSYHRLHQQFYGLPRDDSLLRERLVKEAIHEAGHTLGLTHCDDYDCVMAASHAVEWLDLKGARFCAACLSSL
jgi:predicted Zn-dependent protease